jgi:multiple sugar transport system ATP-binding protein
MARIEIENVTKTYGGGVRAVDGVTLRLEEGEFLVLVGPSGCGKSTLLRMLAGLEEITSGSILIGGRVVNDVPPARRDIAMVFQNYALYPHMTVRGNLAFGLEMRRLPRPEIDRRVREVAETLGLAELLERRPKELSGGQRQRVALGRAIVRQPQAFLFDEPLSNLDAKLRVQMRAELKKLHRTLRTTTVYVTHDQEEAMTLGDRVVVLKDGRIQQSGSPLEVYDRPANRFVAGFVGTPPMNFLSGRVVAENGHAEFESAGLRLRLPAAMRAAAGRAMVLGIRPEHFSDQPPQDPEGRPNALRVRVEAVEPLGDRKDVMMAVPAQPALVGRMEAHAAVREGEEREVYVDLRRAHLFEPGDEGRNATA